VRRNVELPLRWRKVPREERGRAATAALERLRVAHLADRRANELSGGEQQRVNLARALALDPSVLLLDEPAAGLDPQTRSTFFADLEQALADHAATVVQVSHRAEEALRFADRVVVLVDGRVHQVGTPADLYEHPNSLFVAQFLGESSLFHGTLDGGRVDFNGRSLEATRGELPDARDVAVVVRPERVSLHPDGPPPATANAVSGRVVQHIYFGNSRKVEVRLDDGATVLVRESASAAVTPVHADDHVWLTFRPEDAAVLPVDASRNGAAAASAPTR